MLYFLNIFCYEGYFHLNKSKNQENYVESDSFHTFAVTN